MLSHYSSMAKNQFRISSHSHGSDHILKHFTPLFCYYLLLNSSFVRLSFRRHKGNNCTWFSIDSKTSQLFFFFRQLFIQLSCTTEVLSINLFCVEVNQLICTWYKGWFLKDLLGKAKCTGAVFLEIKNLMPWLNI